MREFVYFIYYILIDYDFQILKYSHFQSTVYAHAPHSKYKSLSARHLLLHDSF